MATGSPMMNGDVPHAASQPGTLEETLQLMNILIQENRDLKGKSQGLLVVTGVEKMFGLIRAIYYNFVVQKASCVYRKDNLF